MKHVGMGRVICPDGTCFFVIGTSSIGYMTTDGSAFFIDCNDPVVIGWIGTKELSKRERKNYRKYYNLFIKLFDPKIIDAGVFNNTFHTLVDDSVKSTYRSYRINTWKKRTCDIFKQEKMKTDW